MNSLSAHPGKKQDDKPACMNAKERNLLERAIKSRIERLEVILTSNNSHHQVASETDEVTSPDELNHTSVDKKFVDIARREQTRLKANLEWVASSQGGRCEQCETEIPIQRLLSVPTTRVCVNCCVTEHEQF